MKIVSLSLLLLAVSCGAEDDKNSSTPAPTPAPAQQQPPAPTPAAPMLQSLAIATTADLPTCDSTRNQQLVYVMDAKEFQTCQAGAWVKIEIAAPVPTVIAQQMYNRLSTVELKQKLTDLLPETREVLLGPKFTAKDAAADSCVPAVPGKEYSVLDYKDDTMQFTFTATVRNGGVTEICKAVGATSTQCTSVPCGER